METILALILGIIIVLFIYSFLLMLIKVRSYALLLVALLPVIFFTLGQILGDSDFNYSVLTSGTVIGILIASLIGYLLRHKID